MPLCVVPGCVSDSEKEDIDFYQFPKRKEFSELWMKACNLTNSEIDLDKDVICSHHFDEDAFIVESKFKGDLMYVTKKMKNDALPTICVPNKITLVKQDQESVLKTSQSSHGPSTTISSIEINHFSRNKNKKYSSIRNEFQLEKLKMENEKLLKQLADAEAELVIQKNLYRERVQHFKEIQKTSGVMHKDMFTKQRTRQILSKVFSETQMKVLLDRKKKTNWTDDEMAVGYTIKHLSNLTCYNYLMKNMNLPLPGMSSIKRWIQVRKKRQAGTGRSASEQENASIKSEDAETAEQDIHESFNDNEEYMEVEEDTEEME